MRMRSPSMFFTQSRIARGTCVVAAALAVGVAGGAAMAHPHVWVSTQSRVIFENGALTGLRFTWLFDEMYTANATEGLDTNNDGNFDAAELAELTKVNIEGLKEFDYFTAVTMGGEPLKFADAKDYSMEVLAVDEPPGPQMVAGPEPITPMVPATPPENRGWLQRFSSWLGGLFSRSSPPPPATAQAPVEAKPAAVSEKTKVLALHVTLPLAAALPAARLEGGAKGFQFAVNDAQMFIWFEPAAKDGHTLAPGAPEGCRLAAVEPVQSEEQKKLVEAFGQAGTAAIAMPGKAVSVVCSSP